jgi:hypothetical protein
MMKSLRLALAAAAFVSFAPISLLAFPTGGSAPQPQVAQQLSFPSDGGIPQPQVAQQLSFPSDGGIPQPQVA